MIFTWIPALKTNWNKYRYEEILFDVISSNNMKRWRNTFTYHWQIGSPEQNDSFHPQEQKGGQDDYILKMK